MAKILIVDDSEDNLLVLYDILSEIGHNVFQADSGFKALELLETIQPDCILLDFLMPDMNGDEVCSRLKAEPRWRSIPVIMVSAKQEEEDIVAGLDAGAIDYITKPIQRGALKARLRAALRIKFAQDETGQANSRLALVNKKLDDKNKRLAELYQMANKFVENVSHEFRTPLTVIKEFTSIIRDGLAGEINSKQAEYLDLVSNRTDDLTLLVTDMLDISRLEAGLLGFRRQRCTVTEVFQPLQHLLKRTAAAGEVKLICKLDDTLPEIFCDVVKIGRVIINLVVNAVKFTKQGGQVTLDAQLNQNNTHLNIRITDNGAGIAPHAQQAIFQRFDQQGHNNAQGFGLGLNIAMELVSLHYGRIDVVSEPGTGSTFSFSVPLAEPENLLACYLAWFKHQKDSDHRVSILTAEIDNVNNPVLVAETEALLQNAARGSDVVLPLSSTTWLTLVGADQSACGDYRRRIETAWREQNANRPVAPLPRISTKWQGTWDVESERDELLNTYQKFLKLEYSENVSAEKNPVG